MAPVKAVEASSGSAWDFITKHKLAVAAASALILGTTGYFVYTSGVLKNLSANDESTKSDVSPSSKKKKKSKKKKSGSKFMYPTDSNGSPLITDSYVKGLNNEEKEKISFSLKEEGNKHFKNKDYDTAIEYYTVALKVKHDEVFLSNRSACYMALEKYDKVVEDTTEALKQNPDYQKCLFRRAQALEKLKRYQDAMLDLTAISLITGPQEGGLNNSIANNSLQRVLRSLCESVIESDESFKNEGAPSYSVLSIFFNGLDVDSDYKLLKDLNLEEDADKGKYYLFKALENLKLDTKEGFDLFISYVNQASENLNDIDEAKFKAMAIEYQACIDFLVDSNTKGSIIDKALELHPRARTYILKALFSVETIQLEGSAKYLEKAKALEPENSEIFYQIGQYNLLTQEFEKARKDFEKAVELNPLNLYAIIQTASTEQLLQKFSKAEEIFLNAKQKFPIAPEIPYYYGDILLSQSRGEDALREFNIAIKLQESKKTIGLGASPYVRKAEILIYQGEIDAGIELLEKAVKLDPRSAEAKSILGNMMLQKDNLSKAIELFETAAKLTRDPEAKITAVSYAEATKMQIRVAADPRLNKKMKELLALGGQI